MLKSRLMRTKAKYLARTCFCVDTVRAVGMLGNSAFLGAEDFSVSLYISVLGGIQAGEGDDVGASDASATCQTL